MRHRSFCMTSFSEQFLIRLHLRIRRRIAKDIIRRGRFSFYSERNGSDYVKSTPKYVYRHWPYYRCCASSTVTAVTLTCVFSKNFAQYDFSGTTITFSVDPAGPCVPWGPGGPAGPGLLSERNDKQPLIPTIIIATVINFKLFIRHSFCIWIYQQTG